MLKILLHYDENVGSHYHRLHIPFLNLKDKYEIVISKKLEAKDFEGIDFLIYNRFITMPLFGLNSLKVKHGFKIIIDMDDKVHIPFDHYMSKMYETKDIPDKIIMGLKNADAIMCSTHVLADNLRKYNDNIYVIPNAIDFNIEQFQFKDKEHSDKLRIVYPCSLSHKKDVQLLFNSFKRLANDVNLKDKYTVTLAGYNEGNNKTKLIWEEMVKIFRLAKDYNIINSKPVTSYMEHYDNQDVCLVPLENNSFNSFKSILKLNEAGAKKLAVIASNVLPYSEYTEQFLVVNKTMDWYEHIKSLINNKELLKEYADKSYNFTLDNYEINKINELRVKMIDEVRDKTKVLDTKNTKIISIVYDKEQYSEYETYTNLINSVEQKSYLFEYNPIINIFKDNLFNIYNYEYVGIFSYKFPFKSKISDIELYNFIDGKADVYHLNYTLFKDGTEYFHLSEKYHPGLLRLIELLCNDLGLEYTNKPKHPIWSNFFVAKIDIYKHYIDTVIKPAINLLETKYRQLAWQNSKYMSMSKEKLKELTGLDYYPMHTFVLERMFSLYLHNNPKIKFTFCSGKK